MARRGHVEAGKEVSRTKIGLSSLVRAGPVREWHQRANMLTWTGGESSKSGIIADTGVTMSTRQRPEGLLQYGQFKLAHIGRQESGWSCYT